MFIPGMQLSLLITPAQGKTVCSGHVEVYALYYVKNTDRGDNQSCKKFLETSPWR